MSSGEKLASQHKAISELSREVLPNPEERVTWVSPMLGRFALRRGEHKQPFYELRGVLCQDEHTGVFPTAFMVYLPDGEIIASIDGRIDASMPNAWDELEDAMRFQTAHRFTAPTAESYDNLENYLKNATMDIRNE